MSQIQVGHQRQRARRCRRLGERRRGRLRERRRLGAVRRGLLCVRRRGRLPARRRGRLGERRPGRLPVRRRGRLGERRHDWLGERRPGRLPVRRRGLLRVRGVVQRGLLCARRHGQLLHFVFVKSGTILTPGQDVREVRGCVPLLMMKMKSWPRMKKG
ncbi:hypothetical protein GUJ93_ZPchr0007g4903 [Zizania palustris]|uniref:Uncharacterized protein n=1 Tax=Zizania palustris TaxID=103762 RepID=A0A8J5S618_ZIZPA|nr:hypothetical protein GUJ93_ZPchr0002g22982 [Zizania palustris]KAG8081500.1 hypothetical protein GUJ93_ZPchr0007g4903 [Zizania palustris]